MKTYSKEELDKILELHKKWINKEVDGVRANLSEAYLSEADLSEADLSEADLSEANLYRANLYRANLYRANLSGANLYRANLYRANLYRANLSGANLSEANLSGVNLYEANFYGANLSGVNLSGADLSGADLSHVKDVYSFTLGSHFGYVWRNKDKEIIVKIGCEEHSLKDWLKNYKKIGLKNKYEDKEIKRYYKMLKLIKEIYN